MGKLTITASSDKGLIRNNNEDMILVRNKYVRNENYRTDLDTDICDRFVVALADGMGGCNAGEIASQEVLSSLHFFIGDLPAKFEAEKFNEAMSEWLHSVNSSLNVRGQEDPEQQGMGTTLVAVILYEKHFYWINCGDSRLYRYRDNVLTQLTTDHSLNELTGEKTHSNMITNCIGAGCNTSYIDMMDFSDDVKPGDKYLLCSDGLSDMVDNHHIGQLLSINCNAAELCHAALNAGGYDNVSVCIMELE